MDEPNFGFKLDIQFGLFGGDLPSCIEIEGRVTLSKLLFPKRLGRFSGGFGIGCGCDSDCVETGGEVELRVT